MQQAQQAYDADQRERDRILKMELKKMDVASKVTSDADGNGRKDEIDKARLELEREKVNLQRQKG